VLGLVVFLAMGSVDRNSLAVLYFGIYNPLRLFDYRRMAWRDGSALGAVSVE
jgi:hypothetical protein